MSVKLHPSYQTMSPLLFFFCGSTGETVGFFFSSCGG